MPRLSCHESPVLTGVAPAIFTGIKATRLQVWHQTTLRLRFGDFVAWGPSYDNLGVITAYFFGFNVTSRMRAYEPRHTSSEQLIRCGPLVLGVIGVSRPSGRHEANQPHGGAP